MSEQNEETPSALDAEKRWRLATEAASRRDIDASLAWFASDGVWDASAVGVGVYEGREAIHRFFEEWIGAFQGYETEVVEFRDLGNAVTLSISVHRGRPSGARGLVELCHAYVATWAQGLVERVTIYTDADEARAAAEQLAEERGEAVSENLDLVRSIFAAWECGDYSSVEWAHPEIEFVSISGLETVRTKGLVEMSDFVRSVFGTFANWRDVADEFRELDRRCVLVLDTLSGRGRASGIDLSQTPARGARLFEIDEGRVTRLLVYFDRDRALADLGLEE